MGTIPTQQNIRREAPLSLCLPQIQPEAAARPVSTQQPQSQGQGGYICSSDLGQHWEHSQHWSLNVLLNLESGPWHSSGLGWLTFSQTALDTFSAFRSKCPLTINQLRIFSLQVFLRFAYLGCVQCLLEGCCNNCAFFFVSQTFKSPQNSLALEAPLCLDCCTYCQCVAIDSTTQWTKGPFWILTLAFK